MTRAEGLLGLASRAGQITLGADLALREIKGGRAGTVLLDESAEVVEGLQVLEILGLHLVVESLFYKNDNVHNLE